MQLYSRDGSPAIISMGPMTARGFVAIGGIFGIGVISFGGVMSVGGIAVGLNSCGVVAIGMNAVGSVVFAAINGLGGWVMAGVNALGGHATSAVNHASTPVMGFVVMAIGIALSLRASLRRPARPEAPPWVALARAREQGGFARVRLKWAEGERVTVDGDVELPASAEAVRLAAALLQGAGLPWVLARVAIADEIVAGATGGGYREAPPTARVARVVDIADPPVVGWLPATSTELWWMLGWCARLAAAIGVSAGIR